MPTTSAPNLNIDDLLAEQKTKSKLRREQIKSKRQKTPARVLPFPSQSPTNSQTQTEQTNTPQTNQYAQQPEIAAENQPQQINEEEEKIKKLRPWQIRKRRKVIRELKKLDAKLKKLEKLTKKYESTNWFFLALLAGFVEIADLLINALWATVLLIPVALFLTVAKAMAQLFIFIKIHKIKNDQKTNDQWWWSLAAFIVGLIPGINTLPETILRVKKAHNSAKSTFEKHKDEIKKTQKEMGKLMKQLG